MNTSKKEHKKNFLVRLQVVRSRARAPTCPLATPLSFCPESRFAPPSPTVRTSLLLISDDVCRRCNLACDRLFTLVAKFLHAPFRRPCTLASGDICTPLPPPTLRLCSLVPGSEGLSFYHPGRVSEMSTFSLKE